LQTDNSGFFAAYVRLSQTDNITNLSSCRKTVNISRDWWGNKLELCADELVVGGSVGWSHDRRRRCASHFSSAAAAWLYGRVDVISRLARRRQTG